MEAELISEVLDESGLGIKLRIAGAVTRESLRTIGEEWALAAQGRAERVWVWMYSWDMDEQGPAMAVTFIDDRGHPECDFIPPSTLLLYYMGGPAGGTGALLSYEA